jgi:hypothetical protein
MTGEPTLERWLSREGRLDDVGVRREVEWSRGEAIVDMVSDEEESLQRSWGRAGAELQFGRS